eukprot:5426847-Prymnesium_polylepis.1
MALGALTGIEVLRRGARDGRRGDTIGQYDLPDDRASRGEDATLALAAAGHAGRRDRVRWSTRSLVDEIAPLRLS